jgi:hypothetical protein
VPAASLQERIRTTPPRPGSRRCAWCRKPSNHRSSGVIGRSIEFSFPLVQRHTVHAARMLRKAWLGGRPSRRPTSHSGCRSRGVERSMRGTKFVSSVGITFRTEVSGIGDYAQDAPVRVVPVHIGRGLPGCVRIALEAIRPRS